MLIVGTQKVILKPRLNKEEPTFKDIEPTVLYFKQRPLFNKVVTNKKT